MKKKYFEVSRGSAFSIKVLGKCIYTYYNHLIMRLNKRDAVFDFQSSNDFVAKIMTKEVIECCVNSDFDNRYMEFLRKKYNELFCGIAIFCQGEICGYICGLKPKSREQQYRVRKCEFFVKYVYVYEKFRGKRVASKLFEELFDKFQISEVKFAVRTNNHSAIKAYRKTGAEEIARRKFIRILKFNIPYYKV